MAAFVYKNKSRQVEFFAKMVSKIQTIPKRDKMTGGKVPLRNVVAKERWFQYRVDKANYVAVLALILVVLATVASADQAGKLKIGIKKRVENCENKTKKGDLIHMNYVGTLLDGTEFDRSRDQPLSFTLGSGQVIKGWDQGLLGMCVGEKRRLVIPSDLAYGSRSMGKIPADSTLVFEVELMKIERAGKEL